VWFGALLAAPLAVAALAAAGYFVAAGYFFGRIVESVFLVIGAVMLYGLMALWVQVQRLHLARRRDEEAARTKKIEAATEAGSEVAEARPAQLDIAMIGEQTRSLLHLLVTLMLLGGIWWVWREAVPALSAIGDYTLWTYSDTIEGKQVTHALTVGHLFLAIFVIAITVVAVRRVGALLDILLLQRLELQTDATYAIKVIASYTVAAAGLLLACNILGIRWGDVQWLVAALGVGLGFGLQEIVANFVSGLIMLAERPVRIGDVVTVGSVSGTVSRIHARATVLVDFDNKEVIIPNKAFITERVVNWTLSDQTTRLLIKVGVAYGSDIALVQRVLLDAVRGNGDVLQEPAPSVYFVAFGDSTLDFEIRAFVDRLNKRLRVQHEINVEVARVLRENGIEIPFPQRDLHIRSAPGLASGLRTDQHG
jgi:potassium efflux system protein